MGDINEQEKHLDLPTSEYPIIEELKSMIKPYEELWGLVRDTNNRLDKWKESKLKEIDPEEVEKSHK